MCVQKRSLDHVCHNPKVVGVPIVEAQAYLCSEAEIFSSDLFREQSEGSSLGTHMSTQTVSQQQPVQHVSISRASLGVFEVSAEG